MKKNAKKVIPNSNFILPVEMAINPETGKPGLRDALHYIVSALNNEDGIIKDGLYHVLPNGLQPRLKRLGIPEAYLADFLLVMQYCALVRKIKKIAPQIKGFKWQICDTTFFDEFVNDDSINCALLATKKRHQTTAEIRRLKEENAKLKANTSTLQKNDEMDNSSFEKMNENLATVIAEVEKLRLENADLQKKLKTKSGATAQQTADALMIRFKDSATKKTR